MEPSWDLSCDTWKEWPIYYENLCFFDTNLNYTTININQNFKSYELIPNTKFEEIVSIFLEYQTSINAHINQALEEIKNIICELISIFANHEEEEFYNFN